MTAARAVPGASVFLASRTQPPGLRLRQRAAERLQEVLRGARFEPFGPAEFADGRERSLANRLVTTALRRHGHLTRVIESLLPRGLPKKSGSFESLLRLSLAQLLYLPEIGDHSALYLGVEAVKRDGRARHLAGLMNAALRRAQAEASTFRSLSRELLFPEALRAGWAGAYGEAVLDPFAEALLQGAPLDLTMKHDNPALVEVLGGQPVGADSVRVPERNAPVQQLPGYAEGRWWVQDVAAALPARLFPLAPGARVLDMCAAPGGKTAQLIKSGFEVTALDVDGARLARLRDNLRRLGYSAQVAEADALGFVPERRYEGVLLDAPCSATGTFRRHPEVVWNRSAADVSGRVALQRRFLARAVDCLAAGGVLVYCVCSLEPAEGEAQARWLATAHPELEAWPVTPEEVPGLAAAVTAEGTLRTHPAIGFDKAGISGGMDGFFIARFRRR